MATATAPSRTIPREILEERYRTAVTRTRRVTEPDGRIGIAYDNSRDFYRWERIVERIAGAMYGDHLTPDQLYEVDELAAGAWENLRDDLIAWINSPRSAR